jgi:hypothetical protein
LKDSKERNLPRRCREDRVRVTARVGVGVRVRISNGINLHLIKV